MKYQDISHINQDSACFPISRRLRSAAHISRKDAVSTSKACAGLQQGLHWKPRCAYQPHEHGVPWLHFSCSNMKMPRWHISSTLGCVLTKASPTPRPANTKQEPSPSTRSPRLLHLDPNPQLLPFLFASECCISLNAHCTTVFAEAVRLRPCVPLAPKTLPLCWRSN